MALVLAGTSWPSLKLGPDELSLDKVAHFTAYGVLAALSLRATLTARQVSTMLAVVVCVSALGAVDEWHQQFIPGRSMSFPDWIADTAGATLGVLLVRWIPFLTPHRRPLS